MAANAAVTLLCLGFLAGFFLVLSFLEKPIRPIMAAPHEMREHESDVRWTHSQLQAFVKYIGVNSLVPITLIAFIATLGQTYFHRFEVMSVIVAGGVGVLFLVSFFHASNVMRSVRDTSAYEEDLANVSSSLFRLVRLHNGMFMAIIPLTLAQLFLLFV